MNRRTYPQTKNVTEAVSAFRQWADEHGWPVAQREPIKIPAMLWPLFRNEAARYASPENRLKIQESPPPDGIFMVVGVQFVFIDEQEFYGFTTPPVSLVFDAAELTAGQVQMANPQPPTEAQRAASRASCALATAEAAEEKLRSQDLQILELEHRINRLKDHLNDRITKVAGRLDLLIERINESGTPPLRGHRAPPVDETPGEYLVRLGKHLGIENVAELRASPGPLFRLNGMAYYDARACLGVGESGWYDGDHRGQLLWPAGSPRCEVLLARARKEAGA